MPISQFSPFLQKAIAFLPGTYGTSLIRNHALNGVYKEMANQFPAEVIEGIKDSIDCNIYLFDNKVSIPAMYIILISSIIVLIGAYVLINVLKIVKHVKHGGLDELQNNWYGKYYRKGVFDHFSKDCKCRISMTVKLDVTKLVEYSK